MATVVVGGHSRKVGKTSVTAALIRELSDYAWTAVKISSHHHSNIGALPRRENFSGQDLFEELDYSGASDTSRFLSAGAARSFWMHIRDNSPEDALQVLLPLFHSSPSLIIESNRILRHIQPDVCIMVLRYDVEEFKESARQVLARAHAAVAIHPGSCSPPWNGVSEMLTGVPLFVTANPQILPEGFVNFVRKRLQEKQSR